MQQHNRGGITEYLLLKWILVSLVHVCNSQIFCPDVAELGSVIKLEFHSSDPSEITFLDPTGGLIATCIPGGPCNNDIGGRFNATSVSTNLTYLEIREVQKSDEGIWQGNQNLNRLRTNCIVVPIETPSCSIDSDKNTSYLVVDENITLTVNITDYYCSVPADFMLQTGDLTEDLKMNHSVAEVRGDVFNSTFKLSDSHIGSLGLLFSCNNVNKSLDCGGVDTLLKRPPLCYITSDTNTDELEVGDELSLSVYIEEYSCSRNTKYQLEIGETRRDLKTGVYKEKITFNVTESHFGPVRLEVICNGMSMDVQPVGVVMLHRVDTLGTVTVGYESSFLAHATTMMSWYIVMKCLLCGAGGIGNNIFHVSPSTSIQGSHSEDTTYPYLGIGVAVGVAVMVLLDGVCILGIYLKRKTGENHELSNIHYDGLQGRNVDARFGYGNVRPHGDDYINPIEGADHVYEMPEDVNGRL